MFIAYLIVTVLTAGANISSATLDFIHYKQVSLSMAKAGVPESWMSLLGILKAVAALGLLVGIGIPLIGAAAGLGLICFFIAALIIHLRAQDYSLGLPVFFLVLAVATLALQAATSRDVASSLILRFR
jgi:DoxX-like protein